jgi:HEAT repeat protein
MLRYKGQSGPMWEAQMFRAHSVGELINDLGNSNKQQRYQTERILLDVGAFVIADLIRGLEKQDEETTCAIAAIIIKIGSPAIDALIKTLQTNHSPTSRRIIIDILCQIGDKRGLEPLRKLLGSHDKNLAKLALDAYCTILAQQYLDITQINKKGLVFLS